MMKIETENLILRDFEIGDFANYHKLRNNSKFQRFYPEDNATEVFSKTLVDLFITQSLENPRTHFQFAITDRCNNLLGSCGVRLVGNQIASIGCEFGSAHQGKGYAYEAGTSLLNFAFKNLKLKEVFAETNSENFAALRLCRNLGMELEAEHKACEVFKGRSWNKSILKLTFNKWASHQKI